MDTQADKLECDPDAASNFGNVDLEWSDLTPFYTSVTQTANGATANLPLRFDKPVSQLIDRERTCCNFLTFEYQRSADQLTLSIISDNPDAMPMIEFFLGIHDRADV